MKLRSRCVQAHLILRWGKNAQTEYLEELAAFQMNKFNEDVRIVFAVGKELMSFVLLWWHLWGVYVILVAWMMSLMAIWQHMTVLVPIARAVNHRRHNGCTHWKMNKRQMQFECSKCIKQWLNCIGPSRAWKLLPTAAIYARVDTEVLVFIICFCVFFSFQLFFTDKTIHRYS